MFETIIHTIPYAVGVCVCGGLAAYAGLKVMGRLNGYSIGISIDPVDKDVEAAIDQINGFPHRRSAAERRAARKLADAKSRARTRKYLRMAKELDSEVQRQYEDANERRGVALNVKLTQTKRTEADEFMRDAVRIAHERKEFQAARVAELDAVREARKAEKEAAQSTENQQTEEAKGGADTPR